MVRAVSDSGPIIHLAEVSLCISRGYDLFFTDDADARDVGELHSIEVHGTAGIVAKAFRSGSLSYEETKQVMLELHKKSSCT